MGHFSDNNLLACYGMSLDMSTDIFEWHVAEVSLSISTDIFNWHVAEVSLDMSTYF